METDEVEPVDEMACAGSAEGARSVEFCKRAPHPIDIIEPRKMTFWGESDAEDHIGSFGPLRRIGVRSTGDCGRVWVSVKPMGEAPSA